jgi:hypothetical protein
MLSAKLCRIVPTLSHGLQVTPVFSTRRRLLFPFNWLADKQENDISIKNTNKNGVDTVTITAVFVRLCDDNHSIFSLPPLF